MQVVIKCGDLDDKTIQTDTWGETRAKANHIRVLYALTPDMMVEDKTAGTITADASAYFRAGGVDLV